MKLLVIGAAGFGNVLEGARRSGVRHLVFASSSSIYGANARLPFSEHDNVDHPVLRYAATKKANELMAHWEHPLRDFLAGLSGTAPPAEAGR